MLTHCCLRNSKFSPLPFHSVQLVYVDIYHNVAAAVRLLNFLYKEHSPQKRHIAATTPKKNFALYAIYTQPPYDCSFIYSAFICYICGHINTHLVWMWTRLLFGRQFKKFLSKKKLYTHVFLWKLKHWR